MGNVCFPEGCDARRSREFLDLCALLPRKNRRFPPTVSWSYARLGTIHHDLLLKARFDKTAPAMMPKTYCGLFVRNALPGFAMTEVRISQGTWERNSRFDCRKTDNSLPIAENEANG